MILNSKVVMPLKSSWFSYLWLLCWVVRVVVVVLVVVIDKTLIHDLWGKKDNETPTTTFYRQSTHGSFLRQIRQDTIDPGRESESQRDTQSIAQWPQITGVTLGCGRRLFGQLLRVNWPSVGRDKLANCPKRRTRNPSKLLERCLLKYTMTRNSN